MDNEQDDFENELMKIEDDLLEEMQHEFKKRLEERLQKRIKAKEASMPEVKRLKKNDAFDEN